MRVRPQTILLKDVGPTHHVRTPMSAALESGKCWFQDPAQSERKMAMGGLYVSFHKKKDTSKGRVATVMTCHFLNLMVWLLNLSFGVNSITGDNNAGQSHGILVLSTGTSSVPLFADAEVSVTLTIKISNHHFSCVQL